jgi:membrane protein
MSSSAHTPASAPADASGGARQFVKKLLWVGGAAVRQFFADQCPQQAAAISYRVLFSTAPLAIVFVSIFGLILQDDSVRRDVVGAIVDALPVSAAGRQDVEDALTAIATPASAAGLVSLLLFAWASTGMTGAIRRGLECAMGVTESRPLARGKLVDLALVLVAAVLTLLTIAMTLLGNLVQRDSGAVSGALGLGSGTLGDVLLRVAFFCLSVVVVLLLYRFVPARGLRIRDGLVGAIVTAVLLQLISLASAWIYAKTTRLTVVYGSLTTALVFLYSVYLCASALLVGAEIAAAWSRPAEPADEPVLTQIRRAVVGIFVRQKPSPAALALPDMLPDDPAPDL